MKTIGMIVAVEMWSPRQVSGLRSHVSVPIPNFATLPKVILIYLPVRSSPSRMTAQTSKVFGSSTARSAT